MRRLALLLALLPACFVTTEQGERMEERIARSEEENRLAVRQLEEQRAVLRERVAQADRKIGEVQKKLDELNQAARRTGADLAVEVDRLREDVAKLRGAGEEDQHRLQRLEQGLAQLQKDVEGRFTALKGAGALEEWEAKRKAEQLQKPADKAAFFRLAQDQEKAGERAVARELYEEYARRWPTDPRTADAWFRVGEILYGAARHREAVLAYGKVAEGFPRSDKVPDAMLRTGEAMLALGLPEDARGIFAEVVKKFPKTTAAQKARARLVDLAPNKKKAEKKPEKRPEKKAAAK